MLDFIYISISTWSKHLHKNEISQINAKIIYFYFLQNNNFLILIFGQKYFFYFFMNLTPINIYVFLIRMIIFHNEFFIIVLVFSTNLEIMFPNISFWVFNFESIFVIIKLEGNERKMTSIIVILTFDVP